MEFEACKAWRITQPSDLIVTEDVSPGAWIASELASTGVSTQNGSSYVPEIGRPLQPGPIASPGAFPNGTASVGVIKAPYLGADTGQLLAIAIQENAEREEAKRLEAEMLSKMSECPASECGPWAEEGGEEEEVVEEEEEDGGTTAHIAVADEAEVGCETVLRVQYPHKSKHSPGTVNVVASFRCDAVMGDVVMRVALFRNHGLVSESGYVSMGNVAYAKETRR